MHSTQNLLEVDDVDVESTLPESRSSLGDHALAESKSSLIRRLSRQPLVHFLVAGVILFAAASFFERTANRSAGAIHVSAAEIQRLEDIWSRQYGRNPTPTELRNLIDDYVREEVYYREAVASGLDKDDSIIRRRLVEKMEFLSQEIASGEPSEKELNDYFERNRDKFELPPRVAFSHIFFSPSKEGSALQSDVAQALATLRRGHTDQASTLGDAFMLQSQYSLQSPEEVRALFGAEFADRIFKLHPGRWEGPIRSSYGLHVVRVTQYEPAQVPQLDEVRSQVVTDFKNARLQTSSEAYYARLRQHYRVDVDNSALATALSKPASSARVSQSTQKMEPDVD